MRFFKRREVGSADDPTVHEAVPEPEPEPEPEPPQHHFTVMIVDDDEDVRDLVRLGLTNAGFEVVGEAADGMSAVELATLVQPDIVLLDLHMPDMGGLEVLPLLRAEAPRAKLVVMSAIGATHMLEATIDAGATAFIEKGVSMRSIVKHLERVAHSGAVKVIRPYPLNRDYPADD